MRLPILGTLWTLATRRYTKLGVSLNSTYCTKLAMKSHELRLDARAVAMLTTLCSMQLMSTMFIRSALFLSLEMSRQLIQVTQPNTFEHLLEIRIYDSNGHLRYPASDCPTLGICGYKHPYTSLPLTA